MVRTYPENIHLNRMINAKVIQPTMLRSKSTDIFIVAPSMAIFFKLKQSVVNSLHSKSTGSPTVELAPP